MGFRGSRVQIPPSRLVQVVDLLAIGCVGASVVWRRCSFQQSLGNHDGAIRGRIDGDWKGRRLHPPRSQQHDVEVVEPNALSGQTIDVRRRHAANAALRADFHPAEVVREHKDNVGAMGGLRVESGD